MKIINDDDITDDAYTLVMIIYDRPNYVDSELLMWSCSVQHDFSFTDDATLLFDCVIRAFDPRFVVSHRRYRSTYVSSIMLLCYSTSTADWHFTVTHHNTAVLYMAP